MVRTTYLLILMTSLAMGVSSHAQAEDAPAAPSATTPAAPAPAAPAAVPVEGSKRDACRTDVRSKGLRGLDRIDAMQICMAEGRLDCVKQAVAQKMPVAKRRDFLKACSVGK